MQLILQKDNFFAQDLKKSFAKRFGLFYSFNDRKAMEKQFSNVYKYTNQRSRVVG